MLFRSGSLRCNREVDAVSPICVAVRRSLVPAASGPLADDWPGFGAQLRAQGLYHRVCASARMQVTATWNESTGPAAITSLTREFHNPHFDAQKGDYTLATSALPWAQAQPQPQFHVDQPGDWDSLTRCLIIRGWCYSRPGLPVAAIRLRSGELTLSGLVGLSRPDVRLARADAPDEFTGFEIRGTLPGGRQQVRLEAQLADGTWCLLLARTVTVQRQFLPLWLGGGDWQELMFFQMPAHMAYPARPLHGEKFPTPAHSSRPKISIVTPSYNQARFLPETMRSVLDQAAVTCEYVVQDGGSSDGSVQLIAAMETGDRRPETGKHENIDLTSSFLSPASRLRSPIRPRLIAWESAPDQGQADAIVHAFAKTSGAPDDLMAWINSDDFYLPGTLAYVAGYFARHPDVDVLYGHRVVVNEESQEIARWFLPRHDPEVLRLNDFVPQETLFWRRRIWDRVGGIDPAFKFALDWDLLLRFQAAGARIVRVPRFLACFRVHAAQKTSARMHDIGQQEITLLRERTHGRPFPPRELEQHPRLLRYLRRSAFIEFLWKWGLRAS